jgi:hypothetical protein
MADHVDQMKEDLVVNVVDNLIIVVLNEVLLVNVFSQVEMSGI